jgi:hypothetical protein
VSAPLSRLRADVEARCLSFKKALSSLHVESALPCVSWAGSGPATECLSHSNSGRVESVHAATLDETLFTLT